MRLHEAKILLLTTSLNVSDIGAQVGYSSTGSFTRRFSESVGCSPPSTGTPATARTRPSTRASPSPPNVPPSGSGTCSRRRDRARSRSRAVSPEW
ncbi:helix-turn-helix domain-containing protein [Streptomyces zhihengii]